MAIEGVKSTYIIPVIKKDRETDPNQTKKQKRDPKKDRKKDDDKNNKSEGKVDIRI
jgi:hypothetical protein